MTGGRLAGGGFRTGSHNRAPTPAGAKLRTLGCRPYEEVHGLAPSPDSCVTNPRNGKAHKERADVLRLFVLQWEKYQEAVMIAHGYAARIVPTHWFSGQMLAGGCRTMPKSTMRTQTTKSFQLRSTWAKGKSESQVRCHAASRENVSRKNPRKRKKTPRNWRASRLSG